MGIEVLQAPKGSRGKVPQQHAGQFNLPPEFDQNKWSAMWVEDGPAVQEAAQREWIQGAEVQMTADGWEVWKDKEKKVPWPQR